MHPQIPAPAGILYLIVLTVPILHNHHLVVVVQNSFGSWRRSSTTVSTFGDLVYAVFPVALTCLSVKFANTRQPKALEIMTRFSMFGERERERCSPYRNEGTFQW